MAETVKMPITPAIMSTQATMLYKELVISLSYIFMAVTNPIGVFFTQLVRIEVFGSIKNPILYFIYFFVVLLSILHIVGGWPPFGVGVPIFPQSDMARLAEVPIPPIHKYLAYGVT
jgi:hypothetical protein